MQTIVVISGGTPRSHQVLLMAAQLDCWSMSEGLARHFLDRLNRGIVN